MARQGKAVLCRELNTPVVVEEIRVDPPKRGEVLVRVRAAGRAADRIWDWMVEYKHDAEVRKVLLSFRNTNNPDPFKSRGLHYVRDEVMAV